METLLTGGATAGAASAVPLFELRKIEKSFGSVSVLNGLDLAVRAGEVVGLLGDNGAGKSTAMKIATGVHQPSAGEMRFMGAVVRPRTPADSRQLGIEMVYQDLSMARSQTVAQNIFLGRELVTSLFGVKLLDQRAMDREARRILDTLHVRVPNTRAQLSTLSGGQQQCVAIARAMTRQPRLVILDEPTAALAVREVEQVLNLIRRLKTSDVGVILISHRLNDVFEVADRLVVLRHGQVCFDRRTEETTMKEVVAQIVGAD